MKHRIEQISFGSDLYHSALGFRFEILRKPLGLTWSEKDLSGEDRQIHIAAINDLGKMVGTVVLKPISKELVKLRQMAVDPNLQKSGIGKNLVLFAEDYARSSGYKKIEMIARISAFEFYRKLGYEPNGEEFEEVTVRSVNMFKNL